MKYSAYCVVLGIFFITLPLQASAQQRIRDMSLPPEESLRQGNITHTDPDSYIHPDTSDDSDAPRGAPITDSEDTMTPSGRFMDGYCDPNFQPRINGGSIGALQECANSQKQRACDDYNHLPADAQRVLDHAISCAYVATDGDAANAPSYDDSSCAAFDSQRMRLLRKYWRDDATAHALVFLPDEVLNAGSGCARGRY